MHTNVRMEPAQFALCQLLVGEPFPDASHWDPADWMTFAELASRPGFAWLVSETLDRTGWPDGMPAQVRDDLRTARFVSAAQALYRFSKLPHMLAPLAGPPAIPVVLLKGAALAVTVYPDPAARSMGDIDVLIPRDRVDEAVARVRALGYHGYSPEMGHAFNQHFSHHVALVADGHRFPPLELHWTLASGDHDRHAPDVSWFWERTEPIDLEEMLERHDIPSPGQSLPPLFILRPEAELLYLSAHLMLQHGGARLSLRSLYDIHLVVEQQASGFDWKELVPQAARLRWAAALAATLAAARDHFGTQVPDGLVGSLWKAADGASARLVARRADPLQTRATRLWNRASSLDWRSRLRLAIGVAVPDRAYMKYRYTPRPAWLWPLYYPYRWFDILREGLLTLWKKARTE
ncbi:MAG: nucleotidyltransferase family protein [Anaerolineae bacterium]|jgi:hypothetical protein